jgi:small subunit ribosomal protein S16
VAGARAGLAFEEKRLRSGGLGYYARPFREQNLFDSPPEQNFQNNQRYSNFMAVAIRLRREGAKDHPYYRIVVADSRTRRDGRFIDMVGTYDPMKPGKNFDVDIAKVDAWIGKGAKASETVASIIRKARKAQPKA